MLTRFLAAGLVPNSSLVQIYNLVPGPDLVGFAHRVGGEVGIKETDSVDRCGHNGIRNSSN